MKHAGPVVVQLRARTNAGGAGKIQWRTADQETFPASGQIANFELKAGEEWQEVTIELPVEGQLVHFRLYVPADKAPVEIDSLKVLSTISSTPVREWTFDLKP